MIQPPTATQKNHPDYCTPLTTYGRRIFVTFFSETQHAARSAVDGNDHDSSNKRVTGCASLVANRCSEILSSNRFQSEGNANLSHRSLFCSSLVQSFAIQTNNNNKQLLIFLRLPTLHTQLRSTDKRTANKFFPSFYLSPHRRSLVRAPLPHQTLTITNLPRKLLLPLLNLLLRDAHEPINRCMLHQSSQKHRQNESKLENWKPSCQTISRDRRAP